MRCGWGNNSQGCAALWILWELPCSCRNTGGPRTPLYILLLDDASFVHSRRVYFLLHVAPVHQCFSCPTLCPMHTIGTGTGLQRQERGSACAPSVSALAALLVLLLYCQNLSFPTKLKQLTLVLPQQNRRQDRTDRTEWNAAPPRGMDQLRPQYSLYPNPRDVLERPYTVPPHTHLYKLRPCPSYSARRDRINLVPNLIWHKCSAAT